MEKLELKILFEAIKKDDAKSFSSIMLSNSDLNICFGRFPILSLCYLYGSYKILEKYEKFLMPIHNYNVVDEYYEIYLKFKSKAKKSLKLFAGKDKIVYPLEMLAVLDERFIIRKYFKSLYKNDEILLNLSKIYKLNHKIVASATHQGLVLEKKKLSLKNKIVIAVCFALVAVFSSLSLTGILIVKNTYGIGTAKNPIKISTEQELKKAVKKGIRCYVLLNDITLTGDWIASDFKGAIYGDGHTLYAGDKMTDGMFENMSGLVQDLKIVTETPKINISQNYAILAKNSSGIIQNCTISGNFQFECYSDEEIHVAIFAATNSGEITNCTADVSAKINNNRSSNAFLSAFAGVNNGLISSSSTKTGKFEADTIDMAGIATQNNGTIFDCKNNIEVVQTSSKEWHPNSAGVCVTNNGTVEKSVNYAKIVAESTRTQPVTDGELAVICGGVVCDNYGDIIDSRNFGEVTGKGVVAVVYLGGIAGRNIATDEKFAVISKSKSKSSLVADSSKDAVCVGGVVGYNLSEVDGCGFEGIISATTTSTNSGIITYAGGVVGFNRECKLENSYASVKFLNNGESLSKVNCMFGGVAGYLGTVNYVGMDGVNYTAHGLTYVKNNHYIIDASFKVPAMGSEGYVVMGNVINSMYVEIQPTADVFIAHSKLADISGDMLLSDGISGVDLWLANY